MIMMIQFNIDVIIKFFFFIIIFVATPTTTALYPWRLPIRNFILVISFSATGRIVTLNVMIRYMPVLLLSIIRWYSLIVLNAQCRQFFLLNFPKTTSLMLPVGMTMCNEFEGVNPVRVRRSAVLTLTINCTCTINGNCT
jgi:hypothetical protein